MALLALILLILLFLILGIKNLISGKVPNTSSVSGSAAGSSAIVSRSTSDSGVSSGSSSASSALFWGNNIDFAKAISPLAGTKSLQKWPSSAGFDSVDTDISSYKSKAYAGSVLKGITVIVDAGHGGLDLGAVYPKVPRPDIIESKVNLAMANMVKEKLVKLGAVVVLTRTDDTYWKLYYRSAIAAKATLTDFYNRLNATSKNRAVVEGYLSQVEQTIKANSDEDKEGVFYGLGVRREIKNILDLQRTNANFLFLSLHCNSSPTPDLLHGTKVFYSTNKAIYDDEAKIEKDKIFPEYQFYNDAQRQKFASLLYENITKDNPDMIPAEPQKAVGATNYSVIREQNLVSALIEMGYVNHPSDRAFLLNTTKQNELAESIVKAIYQYYCKD